MKKYILILSLFSLFLIPALSFAQQTEVDPTGAASCADIGQNLRYGNRDSDANNNAVSMLQDFLNTNGFLTATPTGFFGNATLKAVKAFQKSNGITPTGYVAAFTRAKIKDIDCNGGSIVQPVSTTTPGSSFGQPCIKNCNPGFQDQGKVGTPTPTAPATQIAPTPVPISAGSAMSSSYTAPVSTPTAVTNTVSQACTSTTRPFIKVLDPNGGHNFDISENNSGLSMKIAWLMCNIPRSQAKVELVQGTHSYMFNSNSNIVLDTPAALPSSYANLDEVSNAASVLSALGMISGTGYKVVVTDKLNSSNTDSSDASFSITFNNLHK